MMEPAVTGGTKMKRRIYLLMSLVNIYIIIYNLYILNYNKKL